MTLLCRDIRKFQKKIFFWWALNKRDLPWRHTHDPYRIMVSEVMLQQTQVERVAAKYSEFIKTYPTVTSLAEAPTGDVLRLWKGMGYNRRALYLHQAAKIILEKFDTHVPMSEQLLSSLPGIGKYTARAIMVFAFKKDIAMVDTNIRKIMTHFFFSDIKQPEKTIQDVADRLVPKGKPWEWHQALMDFGSAHSHLFFSQSSHSSHSSRSVPFRESTRFYRGRIMDLVRERAWKQNNLFEELIKKYGKDITFYEMITEKLLQECLLARSSRAVISLPE